MVTLYSGQCASIFGAVKCYTSTNSIVIFNYLVKSALPACTYVDVIICGVRQVEVVREECNKNITVMAEEIKALETVSDVSLYYGNMEWYNNYIVCRNVQRRATYWRRHLGKRKPLRKN